MLLTRAVIVLCCSSPVLQEPNIVEYVDPLSRLRWSHSHDHQQDNELTSSFQTELDAVDNRLRILDNRFVNMHSLFTARRYAIVVLGM